jgi:hypothetical protein
MILQSMHIDEILPGILRHFYYHTQVNVREQLRGYRGDVSPTITPPRGIDGTNRMILSQV